MKIKFKYNIKTIFYDIFTIILVPIFIIGTYYIEESEPKLTFSIFSIIILFVVTINLLSKVTSIYYDTKCQCLIVKKLLNFKDIHLNPIEFDLNDSLIINKKIYVLKNIKNSDEIIDFIYKLKSQNYINKKNNQEEITEYSLTTIIYSISLILTIITVIIFKILGIIIINKQVDYLIILITFFIISNIFNIFYNNFYRNSER